MKHLYLTTGLHYSDMFLTIFYRVDPLKFRIIHEEKPVWGIS